MRSQRHESPTHGHLCHMPPLAAAMAPAQMAALLAGKSCPHDPGSPACAGPFCSRLPRPHSILFLFSSSPSVSFILYFIFKKGTEDTLSGRRACPTPRTLPLPGGGDPGSCWPAPPLLPPSLPPSRPPPSAGSTGVTHQLPVFRPTPAWLLCTTSCPADALISCLSCACSAGFSAWQGRANASWGHQH